MSIEQILPQKAYEMIKNEGYTYLDVRTEEEFRQGHPANAFCIPVFHAGPAGLVANKDFLTTVQKHFPNHTKLVLGCKVGGRSAQACAILQAAGYENIYNVNGGFSGTQDRLTGQHIPGWQACGLPVESGGIATK